MYTVNYFIKKFQAIPEEQWCTGVITDSLGRHCALGHCSMDVSDESNDLVNLFYKHRLRTIASINDRRSDGFPQVHPKQRVLAALYFIKAEQQQVEISDPPVTIEDIIGEQVIVQSIELCGSQTTGSEIPLGNLK